MIQINELRIGNLIQEGKVEQIDNSIDEVYYSGEGYYQSNYCCNLNPITITEKKLLDFGFKKKDGENRYEFKNIGVVVLNDCVCVDTFDAYNEVYNSLCLIKHVHQLQNIYFALGGSELQFLESEI